MRAINIMKRATLAATKRNTVHPDGESNNNEERRATIAENGNATPSPAAAPAR